MVLTETKVNSEKQSRRYIFTTVSAILVIVFAAVCLRSFLTTRSPSSPRPTLKRPAERNANESQLVNSQSETHPERVVIPDDGVRSKSLLPRHALLVSSASGLPLREIGIQEDAGDARERRVQADSSGKVSVVLSAESVLSAKAHVPIAATGSESTVTLVPENSFTLHGMGLQDSIVTLQVGSSWGTESQVLQDTYMESGFISSDGWSMIWADGIATHGVQSIGLTFLLASGRMVSVVVAPLKKGANINYELSGPLTGPVANLVVNVVNANRDPQPQLYTGTLTKLRSQDWAEEYPWGRVSEQDGTVSQFERQGPLLFGKMPLGRYFINLQLSSSGQHGLSEFEHDGSIQTITLGTSVSITAELIDSTGIPVAGRMRVEWEWRGLLEQELTAEQRVSWTDGSRNLSVEGGRFLLNLTPTASLSDSSASNPLLLSLVFRGGGFQAQRRLIQAVAGEVIPLGQIVLREKTHDVLLANVSAAVEPCGSFASIRASQAEYVVDAVYPKDGNVAVDIERAVGAPAFASPEESLAVFDSPELAEFIAFRTAETMAIHDPCAILAFTRASGRTFIPAEMSNYVADLDWDASIQPGDPLRLYWEWHGIRVSVMDSYLGESRAISFWAPKEGIRVCSQRLPSDQLSWDDCIQSCKDLVGGERFTISIR